MKRLSMFLTAMCLASAVSVSYAQLPGLPAQNPTRHDVKMTLLSLGSGSTRITYEQAFSPHTSAEFTLGVIGWGWDIMNRTELSEGFVGKFAYKWNVLPQIGSNSWLAGFYLKPELIVADFDYIRQGQTERRHTTQTALLAEAGYQLVLDWFVFDLYTGMGGSWGNGNANNYYHGFMLFPTDSFLAFTAGFRLGVAF